MSSTTVARGARTSDETGIDSRHNQRNQEARHCLLADSVSASASPPYPAGSLVAPAAWQISAAKAGDHHLACQLLASVQRAPSPSEFQAQQDDPAYDPTDRLLCRFNEQVIGHARLAKRQLQFGSAVIPTAQVSDFIVLPEYRGRGCGSELLAAAERQIAAQGGLLALARSTQPQFFLRRGWSVWTRHCYSTARARSILSQLLESSQSAPDRRWSDLVRNSSPARDVPRPDSRSSDSRLATGETAEGGAISIRCWRHIELTGLIRLYGEFVRHMFGTTVRSEAHWQWLMSRRSFDRIYVAIDGPDRFELDAGAAAIAGYAVMKDGRILELVTSPAFPQAATQLLARACSDTIEQDGNYVRLDAPQSDPLHPVLIRAGGTLEFHEFVQGEASLVKILDVEQLIHVLGDQIRGRARAGQLPIPSDLGLHVDGGKFCLEVRPRSVRIRAARRCRSYLTMGLSDWTQLLLGHLDLRSAIDAGRVSASTRVAVEIGAALFPQLPLWRPPWDELPAR